MNIWCRVSEIGSCWVGGFDESKVKKILNIPSNFRPVGIQACGYDKKSRVKKYPRVFEDTFTYCKWSVSYKHPLLILFLERFQVGLQLGLSFSVCVTHSVSLQRGIRHQGRESLHHLLPQKHALHSVLIVAPQRFHADRRHDRFGLRHQRLGKSAEPRSDDSVMPIHLFIEFLSNSILSIRHQHVFISRLIAKHPIEYRKRGALEGSKAVFMKEVFTVV